MYIVRWLTSHPIVAIWALTIIALLLSMGGGKKHETNVASSEQTNTVKQGEPATTDEKSGVESKSSTENHSDGQAVNTAVGMPSASANVLADDSPSAKANASVQKDGATTSLGGLEGKPTDDLLLMAREAFWNNGLDEAASIYQELIQREPKVVEHKGELGNVYWRQGFPQKAASLYAEIAIPMIENGKASRVENMVGFIRQHHPEKATEIEKRLQGLSK
ncbi:MAG: tetratricopeptide repeat protein [Cocleimonas sp.]|nr:tetratricopeptide repeat protein [Cocleimonas sp.]